MRHVYGGTSADMTTKAGVTVSFWTAQTGGSQHTDLLTIAGSPIAGGTVVTATDGGWDRLQGPDGVEQMWAQAGAGPRRLVLPWSGIPAAIVSADAALAAANAAVADAATRVRKSAAAIDPRDYGAVCDGVAYDDVPLQAALDAAGTGGDGTTVRIPRGVTVRLLTGVTVGRYVTLEVPAGSTITRTVDADAGDAYVTGTGALVTLYRNHAKLHGGGRIWAQNDSPAGVVRIERTDGAAQWCAIEGVHVQGPGKTVSGSHGIVLSSNSTFQNSVARVTVSDVSVGIKHSNGANANSIVDARLLNIGTKAHVFDGTIESSVIGGSVLASADITVIEVGAACENVRVIGLIAEPGGTGATMRTVDATAVGTMLIGCVGNTTNLGTDASGTLTEIDRKWLRVQGWRVPGRLTVTKSSATVRTATVTYADDPHLTLILPVGTYDITGMLIYDAATAADLKAKLTTPAGTTGIWSLTGAASGSTAETGSGTWGAKDLATGVTVGGAGVGTAMLAQISGRITVTTAGAVTVQWAQATSDATNTTMQATSSLTALRVE